MVAIILSSFEFACIVFSKVHQLTINKMGRKNAILIAYLILSIATACLGTLDYLDDSQWLTFYLLAILIRIFQGYADSLAISTQFAIIGITYTDQLETVFSYMEAAIGFGTIIGPPLGSLMYNLFSFAPSFYILSGLFFIAFLQSLIFIPNQLNKQSTSELA